MFWISIHTPAKGVTDLDEIALSTTINFNPHSHEGSDDLGAKSYLRELISIHTPTKGVTTLDD